MLGEPLKLTDDQMSAIMSAAASLHVQDRGAFLERVALLLNGHDVGDGLVGRIVRQAQKEFMRAPELEPPRAPSKWMRRSSAR